MDAITGLVSITILSNILGISIFSENTDVSSIVRAIITIFVCIYIGIGILQKYIWAITEASF